MYLEEVAEERHGCELDAVSEALAGEASGWAERLDALVTEIRRSLLRAEALGGSPGWAGSSGSGGVSGPQGAGPEEDPDPVSN